MTCGWERGDVAQVNLRTVRRKVVVVGHAEWSGWLFVKWQGTKHESRVKKEWLEPVRRPRG